MTANNLHYLSYANLPNLLDLIENISFFSFSSYLINGHRNVFLFRSYTVHKYTYFAAKKKSISRVFFLLFGEISR